MNIRKIMSIILAIALLGLMSACGVHGETAPQGESQTASEITDVKYGGFLKFCEITKPRSLSPYGPDYDKETDFRYMEQAASFLSLSSSQDGYYYINNTMNGNYLYYSSKDNMQPMALCNKPNCRHEKRENVQGVSEEEMLQQKLECNAFINDISCIVYYKGAVYALGNLDPLSHDQAMYKISLDGAKKEVVHKFRFTENYEENGNWKQENLTSLMQYFQIHRDKVYYVVLKPGKAVLCRNELDQLNEGPETVFEFSQGESYADYLLYSDYLFVKDNDSITSNFIRIDLKTLERIETNILWINSIFEGMLVCPDNSGVTLRNLDGEEIKKISDHPAATAKGGYIITYNMDDWSQENPVQPFYLYDGNGEPAGEIQITGSSFPNILEADGDRIFFTVYSDDFEYRYLDLTKDNPEFHTFFKPDRSN